MNRYRKSALLALISIASATCAIAQTPPATDTTSPSAASSPHQRDATSSNSTEAPAVSGAEPSAASTPAQRQAMSGKAKHDQMMKDCMAKEQAKNADASAAQVKKTCTEQMKANADEVKKY